MMHEPNPYAPPVTRPLDRAGRTRSGLARMILRAAAVVCGFSLLASPAHPVAAFQGGEPFARAIGAALLLAAFFPTGESKGRKSDRGFAAEEL